MSRPELSVIIPVLDWDLGPLLARLNTEIEAGGLAGMVEVLVADDCSRDEIRQGNRAAAKRHPAVTYYELARRAGRAGIRNNLLARARGRFILFLDADVLPDSPSFLRDYLRQARAGHQVVCGGISYRTRILAGRQYDFSLYKGRRTEWLPARLRQQEPWRYLFTGNVLMRRDIPDRVRFDESFSGYGYEDIEWAIRLGRLVDIRHIDNTCSHLGLVDRKTAFDRMRRSTENYMKLARLHPDEFSRTPVFRVFRFLRRWPRPLLGSADRVLARLFFSSPPGIAYLFFQLDKAVLLASLEQRGGRDCGEDPS